MIRTLYIAIVCGLFGTAAAGFIKWRLYNKAQQKLESHKEKVQKMEVPKLDGVVFDKIGARAGSVAGQLENLKAIQTE
jgi:hypothetical protein